MIATTCVPVAGGGQRAGHWWRWANSGGPMSRRRTERVLASLLRDDSVPLRLPRVIRAGLHFGAREPLDTVLEALARTGLDDAELLRERYAAPATGYLAGAVLLVVGVLLGYLNWKPRYSSDEPIVVWKNDEPRLLRDAMRSGVLENLRISHSSRSAAPAQRDSVSCADLSEHWFKPITDPRNEWSAAAQGMPISCDWTPGSAEVVIINR